MKVKYFVLFIILCVFSIGKNLLKFYLLKWSGIHFKPNLLTVPEA